MSTTSTLFLATTIVLALAFGFQGWHLQQRDAKIQSLEAAMEDLSASVALMESSMKLDAINQQSSLKDIQRRVEVMSEKQTAVMSYHELLQAQIKAGQNPLDAVSKSKDVLIESGQ